MSPLRTITAFKSKLHSKTTRILHQLPCFHFNGISSTHRRPWKPYFAHDFAHLYNMPISKIKSIIIKINGSIMKFLSDFSQKGFHILWRIIANRSSRGSIWIITGHRSRPHTKDAFIRTTSRTPDLCLWWSLSVRIRIPIWIGVLFIPPRKGSLIHFFFRQ